MIEPTLTSAVKIMTLSMDRLQQACWEMPYLAMCLEVCLDKHVEVFANGVLSGVPEVDALQQGQRHGVVGDGETQLHGAAQVLHCHSCTHTELQTQTQKKDMQGCMRGMQEESHGSECYA